MKFIDFLKPQIPVYILSVILAVTGVIFGIIPYFIAHKLLVGLSKGMDINSVILLAGIMITSFALQLLFHSISTAISHKTAFSLLEKIRLAITEKMMKMPLGYTRKKGSGYFHSILIDGIERLEYPLAHAIPETTSNILIPVAIIGILFSINIGIALSVLIPAAVTLVIYLPMYMGVMNDFADKYYTSLEKMNGRVIEYIRGNKEIKVFGNEDNAYSKFEESIDEYKRSTLKLYNKMYFISSPGFVLLSSITVSVISVGGLLYLGDELSAYDYLFSIIISMGIGTSLLKFTEFMDNFYYIKNGKRLIEDILSAPELKNAEAVHENPVETKGSVNNNNPLSNEIVLENVCFAYEKEVVLKNISITFEENKKVAIVGSSGSGKTTIANLISRFWDVSSGAITMGGVNYKDIPLNTLMNKINYVTQDTFHFNMSIMENIRMGNVNATDDEVKDAAELAHCKDFINELENGYDTIVGNEGARLSGGQRQRISIARAILKNAPILILDEATAYTDMENQHKLQESLKKLCEDKTLILIAHRLSTLTDCDKIIVLDKGEICGEGSHKELLETSSMYRKMWEIHNAGRSFVFNG